MEKTIEIPEGYEARIEGNKVILKQKESEDERMINELQGFLSSYGSDYFGTGEWQKFDDWLERQKEQKPHWKPSEKQMEELEYGIGLLGNMNVANALRELYSDLKKL
jgi:hypothetical protein